MQYTGLPACLSDLFFCCGAATQRRSWPPHSWGFLDHTQRRTTVGRTPLDEWSARRRDLYLTTHNTHNRQISMPPVRFEPTISAGERPQTYALDRAATGTGLSETYTENIFFFGSYFKNNLNNTFFLISKENYCTVGVKECKIVRSCRYV
jgi:hypothetical protein